MPELLGREPRDVEAIWHELHAKLHFVGAGGVTAVAIAAADIALWDALAVAAEPAALPLPRRPPNVRFRRMRAPSTSRSRPRSSSSRWPTTGHRASVR